MALRYCTLNRAIAADVITIRSRGVALVHRTPRCIVTPHVDLASGLPGYYPNAHLRLSNGSSVVCRLNESRPTQLEDVSKLTVSLFSPHGTV
jgi:hypothetical protein